MFKILRIVLLFTLPSLLFLIIVVDTDIENDPVSPVKGDQFKAGFASPPSNSRPETWFHLIGGNVARQGLTADLEAIKNAGIEGIQLFHGNGGIWPGVSLQIQCLSPSWDEMISHVANECKRLGLHFSMQNCPGWAMSGGPWITPENAMRKLIWSRKDLNGGGYVTIDLALPQPNKEEWRDYRDIAVIAFPKPLDDKDSCLVPAAVHSNYKELVWTDLLVNRKNVSIRIPSAADTTVWVEVKFNKPVTLRTIEFSAPAKRLTFLRYFDPNATIHIQVVTTNGLVEVANRSIPRSTWQDNAALLLAFPDATATSFRITFENKTPLQFNSLLLSSAARINDWQGQGGYVLRSLDRTGTPVQNKEAWVSSKKVLDLSKYMDGNGKLNWQAPPGKWTVLRFGHVNTGAKNGPAPKEATGFECDKLSTAGADAHFAGYIGRITAPGGPADGGRLKGMVIDSWECGTQTWSKAMEQEFLSRRGYALRPWLPAVAGWVVDDHNTSERFLRDWRTNLNDLLVSNYYGRLAELGHNRGLKLSFETGPGDIPTGDILQYFGKADIPMCEFWQPNDPDWGGKESKPILPAVSAGHIYGKPRIAAEAFTNVWLKWDEHPFMLKNMADYNFTLGLNHLVFHTYTHNPRTDLVPGTSFGGSIGTPFLRGQTWWKYMPQFTNYLSRCQFMLEKGQPVADVLWYLGDDLDHKPRQDSPFPKGYKFDYLNSDALINRITVADGLLKTPEGITWKVLWLANNPRLTTQSLTRILDLVKQGATVIGNSSFQNPSLSGGAENDKQFNALIHELWGNEPGSTGERKLGKGKLIWGKSLETHFSELGMVPDVIGANSAAWCHRSSDGDDIYFVAADRKTPLIGNLSFHSKGNPELWDPLTGTTRPVCVFKYQGYYTSIPLELPAAGSVFVVFRHGNRTPAYTRIEKDGVVLADATDNKRVDKGEIQAIQGLTKQEEIQPWVGNPMVKFEIINGGKQLLAWQKGDYKIMREDKTIAEVKALKARTISIAGPWSLSFPAGWDAPENLNLPELKPWSDLEDKATRSFSGTATYSFDLQLDALDANSPLMLDLGRVEQIAELTVNGKPVTTLWTAPFRADITPFVRIGSNRIDVKVTNTWFNRLAYDASLPDAQRKTWTINGPEANSVIKPSGLIGPVVLCVGQIVDLAK